ncbi:MAG: prepilin-type N-terminal cleavage/methylation domain-containing protein [Gammaproteobacteria bacterium]|nr:prepilin-type N-terminal cleavage/methylation domain-containing protein [Gammaproteobacteria bacterium]
MLYRSQSGSSLFEVMVALFIVGVSVSITSPQLSTVLGGLQSLEQHIAHVYAHHP